MRPWSCTLCTIQLLMFINVWRIKALILTNQKKNLIFFVILSVSQPHFRKSHLMIPSPFTETIFEVFREGISWMDWKRINNTLPSIMWLLTNCSHPYPVPFLYVLSRRVELQRKIEVSSLILVCHTMYF